MKMTGIAGSLMLSAALVAFIGCGPSTPPPTPAAPPAAGDGSADAGDGEASHGHTHGAGPHDGTLADWGGGAYHVEFTVSHDDKEATVYILGDDEKSPAPIAAAEIKLNIKDPAMDVVLKASPQDGDPAGKASRFVGNHDSLAVVQEYEGTITGVVDGTPYSGDFKEEPHGHE